MSNDFTSHFSADDAALLLIDFQPQMLMGVESHDRNAIKNNLQIIAKSAKLFNVPTVLSTVTAKTFAGPFVPEVTEGVFPRSRGRRSHVHQRLAHSQLCEGRRSNGSQAPRHRRPLDGRLCRVQRDRGPPARL